MNINEIADIREQITAILSRLDELERAEKQKGTNIKFDPTEIYNEDDIPFTGYELPFGECDCENFYISVDYQGAQLIKTPDDGSNFNKKLYHNNNYIPTEYQGAAEELLDIIRFNMFLTRQKLIYCPDFVPDENYNERSHGIKFHKDTGRFYSVPYVSQRATVCFPTREIAEKICAKLNDYLDKCRKEV